ncbi:MAG: serine hydrolase [Bacteroidales bacterium]
MKKFNLTRIPVFLLIAITTSCTAPVKEEVSNDQSVRSPEAEGISSRAILDFLEAVDNEMPDELHSFMLRRHGNVVAQGWWAPYEAEIPHMLYSLSKSFTSTAIGIAIDEGLLSIDDPVISFFPDDLPGEPGENLKAMRIRDLLKMNSGHLREPGLEMRQGESWVKGFLAQEVQFKPGTHFVYNSSATYMLSAIIQKVTGMTLLDYLTPRLFEPLGIEHPTWETDPDGINTGGWGLSITTEDISKLGQLYLQKGAWKGKQLVSEEWVEEATTLQTSNGSNPESDWEQGYGYQFWRCRHDIYRGDGAFGQFCIVMPEQDAVLAITSGTGDMQKVMNLVWEHLLPGMKEGGLPPDEEGAALLDHKLNELAISYVKGEKESSEASAIFDRSYNIVTAGSDVRAVSFDFNALPHVITFNSEKGQQSLKVGYHSWETGSFINPGFISTEVAVCGAWVTTDTYLVRMVYFETPYIESFTFRFSERQLLWDRELNVSFGPTKLETLKGISVD